MVMIKTAGIFAGLPKELIKELITFRIGEDSIVKPVVGISQEGLNNNAFFGKLNGKTVVIVVTHIVPFSWAIINPRRIPGRNSQFYHSSAVRNVQELEGAILHDLQIEGTLGKKETLDRLDWYEVERVQMRSKERLFQKKEILSEKVDTQKFKIWVQKQLKNSKKSLISKFDDILNESIEIIPIAKKHQEYFEMRHKISKHLEKMSAIVRLFDFLEDKIYIITGEKVEFTLDDAKKIKSFIKSALE